MLRPLSVEPKPLRAVPARVIHLSWVRVVYMFRAGLEIQALGFRCSLGLKDSGCLIESVRWC